MTREEEAALRAGSVDIDRLRKQAVALIQRLNNADEELKAVRREASALCRTLVSPRGTRTVLDTREWRAQRSFTREDLGDEESTEQ